MDKYFFEILEQNLKTNSAFSDFFENIVLFTLNKYGMLKNKTGVSNLLHIIFSRKKQLSMQNKNICELIMALPYQDDIDMAVDAIKHDICNLKTQPAPTPLFEEEYDPPELPNRELAGVIFYLGDGGDTCHTWGSHYFDEPNWGENAEYYSIDCGADGVPAKWAPTFYELLSDINPTIASDITDILMFSFMAYVVTKAMKNFNHKTAMKYMKNAGIAISFTDRYETILGSFSNGVFYVNVRNIELEGYSKKMSSCPPKQTVQVVKGALYTYLLHNYCPLIRNKKMGRRLYEQGEIAAEEIVEELKDEIIINRCSACSHIKKTIVARLCLSCGTFE